MQSYRGAPVCDGVFGEEPPVDRKSGEQETARWVKSDRTVQESLRQAIAANSGRPIPNIRLPQHVMDIFRVQNGELILLGNGALSLVNAGIVILDPENLKSCVQSKPARQPVTA